MSITRYALTLDAANEPLAMSSIGGLVRYADHADEMNKLTADRDSLGRRAYAAEAMALDAKGLLADAMVVCDLIASGHVGPEQARSLARIASRALARE